MPERDGTTDDARQERRLAIPRSAYRELDDAGLIDAMRRADERAIDEFIIRHQRLLHDRVRRWRMALTDVDDCIADVLEDVALLIVNGRIRPSRSLAAYVVKAFRVQVARRAKTEGARQRVENDAVAEGGDDEGAVSGTVSQVTLRASHGIESEPASVPGAVARLASMLDEGISEEERRILTWLSNFVSQRDICEWLGVTYAAGTQRIWRLRSRLRSAARSFSNRFDGRDRTELERFFRRLDETRETGRTPEPQRGPDTTGACDEA